MKRFKVNISIFIICLILMAGLAYANKQKPVIDTQTATADLTAAALSYSYTFSNDGRLAWIVIAASEAITETITVTLDNIKGSNYDTTLKTRSWSSEQYYFWAPDTDLWFEKGQIIKIAVTDGNSTGNVYVTIQVEY